ncbi:TDRD1_4_6_7 [Lepeophtheirus salmonis]|uniref:RNA helicase n=1 Tax=Lepeophtheirus salmonis TaxID=72036 RepID=A0A7R8CSK7_LEPSM|nr:TDRD1_4_6_7 [Lepeophtheirus salmonis]CAF2917753.1 TDRD1_4_6_7 [Lepeophtheirus salmonis]
MICSSFKTCLKFEEYCHFICPHVKVISIYHSKELDGNTHAEILNGCDIIIATPLSLLRHLANNAINLDSLDTLIFEDGNLLPLFKTFYHEINQVMKSLSKNKLVELLKAKCSHRTVVFASKHDFDTLYETLISSSETIIAISKKRANMSQEGALKMWFGNEASFVTLLITDEMLIYVIEEIYNADCIIHFNLPHQSRTEFQLRFMLMRDNFKRYKCDPKQTTCHIFVDDQKYQGLKYIYQFLLRVKNNKITDVISKNSPEYDQLIAYFKNRGLHEDYPLEMNIKIKKLKSENQIFDFEKSNLELMEELKGVDTRGLSLIMKPEPDTLYLFKHKVNDLRRIRTIPRNGQHVIQFYDLDGNEDVIDFDEDQHILYECPSHIANENKYPRSRAQIVFIGVKPLDKDSEWCRVIRDTILDAVCTTNSGGQTLTPQISGRIVLRIGYTFWLSELEILNETLESGIHQSKVQLLKKNIFLSKQIPLDHHQYDSHDSSLSIENRIESDKDLDYENLMPMTSAFLNDPYEEVVISNLESPDSFYVQRIKFLDLLTSLEDDIEADVIQNKFIFQNGSNYRKGDLILAKYNGKFRRGKILDSNVEIQILYVDYGTISIVHRSDIIPYNSYILDYFNRLPCQAIKCHLHNVSPIGIEWYVECLDYLNYEVMSYEKIICEIRSTSPEASFGYSVALFIPDEQNNGIFVCLAQYLYECEYCEIIDATQYCSQTLNYFNTDGFNSDLSSDEGDHVQPPSLNAISAGDQIITSDVNLFSSSNDGMEIKLPEFIKWYESCSELFLTVSWKLIYDAPINPNSLYIRIDKYSVFIRYMEKDSIMHETPILLILNDLVKPSKTSVVYGKGRSFKLVLVKKSKKIWNAALFSGLSFQWITFDFDRNPEKSHKSNSPLPIDKKAHIAFPEAYFDHSGSEESDEYASSEIQEISSMRYSGTESGLQFDTLNFYKEPGFIGNEEMYYQDEAILTRPFFGKSIILTGCKPWTLFNETHFHAPRDFGDFVDKVRSIRLGCFSGITFKGLDLAINTTRYFNY